MLKARLCILSFFFVLIKRVLYRFTHLTENSWHSLQYFADRDIFCAGRVAEEDLNRVAAAAGGTVQTSVNNIIPEVSEMNFFACYLDMLTSFKRLLIMFL